MNLFLRIIPFLTGTLFMAGCLKSDDTKSCTNKTVESELSIMNKFATDSSINVIQDQSGLLYEVVEPGTGTTPTSSSTVVAKYVGRFMNGKGFDSSYVSHPEGVSFPLTNVIAGWALGIPKIKEGGKLKLIVPSSLAYGCTGFYTIPPNEPLYFYIELIDVQ